MISLQTKKSKQSSEKGNNPPPNQSLKKYQAPILGWNIRQDNFQNGIVPHALFS